MAQDANFQTANIGVQYTNFRELPYVYFFFFSLWLFCFVFLKDKVSLYTPGCPVLVQASLELTDPPVPASQVLGLKACTAIPDSLRIATTFTHAGWIVKTYAFLGEKSEIGKSHEWCRIWSG